MGFVFFGGPDFRRMVVRMLLMGLVWFSRGYQYDQAKCGLSELVGADRVLISVCWVADVYTDRKE